MVRTSTAGVLNASRCQSTTPTEPFSCWEANVVAAADVLSASRLDAGGRSSNLT
jgi:hypothetical protein